MSWQPSVSTSKTEQDLIARAKTGDHQALDILFERYRLRVEGYCKHFLKERDDYEGVTQEVFVRAFENLDSFTGSEDQFIRWLFRIARNYCLNLRRANHFAVVSTDAIADTVADSTTSSSPIAHVERTILYSQLLEELLQIAQARRWKLEDYKIFSAYFLDDKRTVEQVADILRMPRYFVRYRFYRHIQPALKRLRCTLEVK